MPEPFAIDWEKWLTPETLLPILRALLLLVLGFPCLRLLAGVAAKALRKHVSKQAVMLVRKAIFYSGTVILSVMILRELGFKLTTLLGAAGIVGVAVGFASQTSLSNIISGVFLISEKPFEVGDVIKVGETVGVILSIDLLSVKLRTFDNRYVRIPNETLIKTEITNVTRFPIRRLDININVAYKENIRRVMKVLREVANANPYCLDEPEPFILLRGFGESALEILLGVWFAKEDFVAVRNSLLKEIKERFDAEGIEIPFPHRSLYVGAATAPFPVRVVEDDKTEAADEAAIEPDPTAASHEKTGA